MDKKQIRKCNKIDMPNFLRNYYFVDNESLILKLSDLSHKELKTIALLYGIDLVRIKFDLVSMDQVLTGTVVLVNDAFGNSAPYVNPNRVFTFGHELDTELDLPFVSTVIQEVKFDKKGRQKSLKRIIKLRKGD